MTNRLWNGKKIKKWPMLKANSVLRAKNKANADQVIWYFELAKFQPSYICSGPKEKQQEKRIDTREERSHLRKINEEIRQKLGRHTSHSLMQLPAISSLLSQSLAHKINDKLHLKKHSNYFPATFGQNQWYDALINPFLPKGFPGPLTSKIVWR